MTRLASDRLVVTGQDAITRTEMVELVHEALISEWSRLRSWIKENRDFRLWQERLRSAMQQWKKSSRDEGALLRGKPLVEAEDWLQKRSEELTAEREFITASVGLREREKEKLSRQRKRTIVGLTSGLVGALGLAAVAGVGWWFATNAATNDRIKALVSESRTLFTLSEEESKRYRDSNSSKSSFYSKAEQEKKDKKNELLFQQASLKAIKAGQELQHAIGVETETRFQVLDALQRIVGTRVKPTKFTLSECDPNIRGPLSLDWTSDKKMLACVNYDGTVRLWDVKTGKKIAVFRGDSEWVDDVQFSPNGKMIASGTVDGTVKLWDRSTGKEIRALKGHLSQVASISFSPDSQTVAAANYDGTIIIWEVATGKELKTLLGHPNSEYSQEPNIFFSPNSKFLVSLAKGNSLKLWEVLTGTELKTVRAEELFNEIYFNFSSDSQTLIYSTIGSNYPNAKISFWSISEKRELKNILVPGEPFFSPDGKTIAVIDYEDKNLFDKGNKLSTSSTKGTVSLWDTSTGKKVKTLSNLPSGKLSGISFSSDSSLLAIDTYVIDNSSFNPVPGSTAKVTFWRRNGARLKTIEQLGKVFQLNFSPDGQKVAVISFGTSKDKNSSLIFKLWDVSTGRQLKTLSEERIISGFRGLESRFSSDGKMIAAVSSNSIASFFDSLTGAELSLPNVNPSRNLDPPMISKDGKDSTTFRTDGSMRMRNRLTGKEIKFDGFDVVLKSDVHISDDDKTITTVNWHGKVQKRELSTGRILGSTDLPFRKFVSELRFSPDGRKIAAANIGDTVTIWDATTSKEILTLKGYANKADLNWARRELYFSPDGKTVAALGKEDSYGNGANLELWDISTGKAIQFSEAISGVKSIFFRHDNDELAILKADDTIQLWNLSERRLIKTIRPTIKDVANIQFSPKDSDLLFIQGRDGGLNENLKIFNISTEREIASFKIPSGTSNSVDFSADGNTLILRSENTFTFVNFDMEDLLKRGCNIVRDYLKNNPSVNENDKHICNSAF